MPHFSLLLSFIPLIYIFLYAFISLLIISSHFLLCRTHNQSVHLSLTHPLRNLPDLSHVALINGSLTDPTHALSVYLSAYLLSPIPIIFSIVTLPIPHPTHCCAPPRKVVRRGFDGSLADVANTHSGRTHNGS